MIKYYLAAALSMAVLTYSGAQTPCENGMAGDYPCQNIDLLSHFTIAELGGGEGIELNDVWGWVDPTTNKEYALVGMSSGTVFVDIEDPINPVILGTLPEHHAASSGSGRLQGTNGNSIWHDIKVYSNYAYIVSEDGGHGMQIFDLTQLRSVVNPPVEFKETALYDQLSAAHNIVINEATGYAYAVGVNGGDNCSDGGLHIINLQDPTNPTYEACYEAAGYTHDAQCVIYQGPDTRYQGQEICFNFNAEKFVIANVNDKADMSTLASINYEGVEYVHQGWLTEDHKYVLSNDELDELNNGIKTKTFIWDVQDLTDPKLIGSYTHATNAIDHNLYILGDRAYMSNYTSGLRMINTASVSDGQLSEIGYFDSFPAHNRADWFGTWSNYPYFPSGVIPVSDISGGLFLVKPNINSVYMIHQPESTSSCPGASVSMGIEAGGYDQTYAWQVDDGAGFVDIASLANYANADTDTLTIMNIATSQAGYMYRCKVVSTGGDEVISESATLSIADLPEAGFTFEVNGSSTVFTNTSVASQSYEWDFGDGSEVVTTVSPTHTYTGSSTDYTTSLTATNDCASDIIEQSVTVVITGIENFDQETFKLYPIPAKNSLKVELTDAASHTYTIHSVSGKVIKKGSLSRQRNVVDLKGVLPGIYMMSISSESGSNLTQRIIVE